MLPSESAKPAARPLCPDVTVSETEDSLVFSHRTEPLGQFMTGCMVPVFCLFLLAFFVFGTFQDPKGPLVTAWMAIVLLPLLLLAPLASALYAFCSEERIVFDPVGLTYQWTVLRVLRCRYVPWGEVKAVRADAQIQRHEGSSQVRLGLTFETLGSPLRFAFGIGESEAHWLADLANRYLDAHRPAGLAITPGVAGNEPEVLQPGATRRDPPSDSLIHLRRGQDVVELVWRGQWRLGSMAAATWIAVFVNGIVAVPLAHAIQAGEIFKILFLTPFAVFGLLAFAASLASLTAPAWSRRWIFRPHEAAWVYGGLGLRWTRRYPLSRDEAVGPALDRMELHRSHPDRTRRPRRPDAPYALSFIRPDGTEWLRMEGLTEGEARWIAGILFEEFPTWFPPPHRQHSLDGPAKRSALPIRCRVPVETEGDDLVLTYHDTQRGVGCFVSLCLLAWSAGCVILLAGVLFQPELLLVLFATPFFVAWLFMAAFVLRAFFAVEQLRLGPQDLDYRWSIKFPLSRRRFPLEEVRGARAGSAPVSVEGGSERYASDGPEPASADKVDKGPPRENCVLIETAGEPIRFAKGIDEAEQRWLVSLVNRYLEAVRGTAEPAPDFTSPPPGSLIRLRHTPDGIVFSCRGRWSLGFIAGYTGVTLFWNSIVAVFLLDPPPFPFNVGLYLFLVPFELIGLLFFIGWFGTLTAPAWRLEWLFGEREIVVSGGAFGLARRRCYQVLAPFCVEPRQYDEDRLRRLGFRSLLHPLALFRPRALWGLRLAAQDGTELFEIDGLTEGEARWMAHVLALAPRALHSGR